MLLLLHNKVAEAEQEEANKNQTNQGTQWDRATEPVKPEDVPAFIEWPD